MQTTLLTIAIAIILALLTALVGPLFFPFNNYRSTFEAEASRLIGSPVRIFGPIDVRILPTPVLTLQGLEIGPPGSELGANLRALHVEFALGALVRGELRASELRLDGPELVIGLDKDGRMAWPPGAARIDPDAFSVEHVNVENGHLILTDAASGSRLSLENVWFKGDLRSLAGPLKGEGGFNIRNLLYPFTISMSRPGDDGASKFRLGIVPIEPERIRIGVEGSFALSGGAPQIEGVVNVHRPVASESEGGRVVLRQPWQLSSRVKGDSAGAVLEQIEYVYGPEDRAIRLKGDAKVTFGAQPKLKGVLSSPQLDLDRVLGLPDDVRRKPLAAIKALAMSFSGQALPIPLDIGISTEAMTLAGAQLQRVTGDVRSDGESLEVEALEFRAPGFTQVRLSGRLTSEAAGPAFSGPMRIEANDPRAFVAWLSDRNDLPAGGIEPLRVSGDLALGGEAVAIERLKADFDRVSIEGRVAYRWAATGKPARLDADLRAPEVDIDRLASLASAALGDVAFDWPREGTLALDVGRATIAGIQTRNAMVKMWLESSGLMIERLAVADFGGASLSGSGRLDMGSSPRGTMTFDLDARRLDGAITLLDKVAPRAADWLRRAPGTGAKLSTTLSIDDGPANAASRSTVTRFTVNGRVGDLKVALSGGAAGLGGGIRDFETAAAANIRLDGRIEADDGATLIGLLGLGRMFAVDRRPGQLRVTASGPLNGELRVDGQLTAAGLDVSGQGTARLSPGPRASLRVDVANADLRPLRQSPAGRPAAALPVKLRMKAAFDGSAIALDEIDGSFAGSAVRGKLAVAFNPAMRIDGDLDVEAIDVPALAVAALGMPPAAGAAAWPAEPFGASAFGDMSGKITLRSARVAITPRLMGTAARGLLQLGPADISLDNVEATLAGGRLTAGIGFHRDASGISARGSVALTNADAATVLPGGARLPVTGKLGFDAAIEGTGLSAAALVGSMTGSGTYKLETAVIAGIDPRIFDTLTRSVDQGLSIDAVRVGDRASRVMSAGRLPVPRLEGTLTIANGQLRLSAATARTEFLDLTISGGMNLTSYLIDGRVFLVPVAAPGATRPEVAIGLKGPPDAPERTLDVSAAVSWLALRAVEQQAKRLQDLQNRRVEPSPQPAPAAPVSAAPSAMQPVLGVPSTAAPVVPPVPYVLLPLGGLTPLPVLPPAAAAPSLPRVAAPDSGAAQVPPQVPSLPPPIEVRPSPAPRAETSAPRVDAIAR